MRTAGKMVKRDIQMPPKLACMGEDIAAQQAEIVNALHSKLTAARDKWVMRLLDEHLDEKDAEVFRKFKADGDNEFLRVWFRGKIAVLESPNRFGVMIYNKQYWETDLEAAAFIYKEINTDRACTTK